LVYDLLCCRGNNTAGFAVKSFRRWWREIGHPLYPQAEKVLICADSGGSNGYRIRLWKLELQRWANETGLDVTVCHYPPGTSKWNKIEHRLFSHITMNWRGRPLVSYQVIVNLIGATTTQAGLRVQADLDTDFYPTKVKVTDKQLATVDLLPHRFHGEWNYTIKHQIISV
jgi:Rhodopirellula transposase DDE domain